MDVSTITPVTLDHIASEAPITINGHVLCNPIHQLQSDPHLQTSPPATQTVSAQEVFHKTQALIQSSTRGVQTREQLDRLLGRLEGVKYVSPTTNLLLNSCTTDLLDLDSEAAQQELEAQQPARLHDPPVLNPKGRPRTTRLAASREGRGKASGGGGRGGGVQARWTLRSNTNVMGPVAAASQNTSAATEETVQTAAQEQPVQGRTSRVRRCGICREQGHDARTCGHDQE